MKKPYRFINGIAALLAFGLIVGLLPSLAAAQDLSTLEKRAAWLTGQFSGASIGSNAKFGATAALARLALNPDDAYVINRITHFYDKVPEGSNAEQFTYSGVAWVLGKYWDKFTPARAQLMAATRMNLLRVMRSLYDYGYVENLSTTYAAVSNWRPPAAINSLARGQTVPYELTASARGWIAYWGVGDPGKLMGLPGECVRYVYRDKLYAMGSGFFQYNPRQYNRDYNAFGIIYKSHDQYNYIECYHPYWRSNDRTWKGINSPFMQWAKIFCFDLSGKKIWETTNGPAWTDAKKHPGARACAGTTICT